MNSPTSQEEYVLSDEAWERHCSKPMGRSNSAVRPDKSRSMLAAMIDNEESFKKMTTGDGDNILELLRSL